MEMHREWAAGGRMGDEWGIQHVMRRSTWFVVPLPLSFLSSVYSPVSHTSSLPGHNFIDSFLLILLIHFLHSVSPQPQFDSYYFYIIIFSRVFLLTRSPLYLCKRIKHLTGSSSAPLPADRRCRLPARLAPSLCSAVKLVQWGSRKWVLQTKEWREVGSPWCASLKTTHVEDTWYFQNVAFNFRL